MPADGTREPLATVRPRSLGSAIALISSVAVILKGWPRSHTAPLPQPATQMGFH